MSILTKEETKLIGKRNKLIAKQNNLKEEMPELRKEITALQKKLYSKEKQARSIKKKLLDPTNIKDEDDGSPPDSLVMIDGLNYKIGARGRVYYHNKIEWISSSKSVREIEEAVG